LQDVPERRERDQASARNPYRVGGQSGGGNQGAESHRRGAEDPHHRSGGGVDAGQCHRAEQDDQPVGSTENSSRRAKENPGEAHGVGP
ncbi:hypothetical protein KR032_000972, partial [Drosophila birchii]